MANRTYSVPFTQEIRMIFEVEAKSPAHAAAIATEARLTGVEPTHVHEASIRMGTVKLTVDDTDTSNGE